MGLSDPNRYQQILRDIAREYPNEYKYSSPATYFQMALQGELIDEHEYKRIRALHSSRSWDWTGD